jgi:hypothetical protein
MKSKFIYLLGFVFLAACSDNSETEGGSHEYLPEGKWNGEYMEVESEDNKDKNRPTKKSNGGEILNLGKVVYTVNEKEEKIIHFDKRKNDITINENQITIRIKDANERFFLIGIHKDEIYKNPEGKYIDIRRKKDDTDPMFSLRYITDLDDRNQTYQCTKGTLEVKKLNFKSGEVFIKSQGELQNMKDIQEGTKEPFEVEIKMHFESVVGAFNPNE